MPKITALRDFLSIPGLSDSNDLESWRNWLSKAILLFALFAFPLAMAATFPIFLKEGRYVLMGIDIGVFLFIAFSFFTKMGTYRGRGSLWIAILYMLMVSFYISLGPHYARSAWTVMIVVMAAILFGTRAALMTTVLNAIILFAIYFWMDPDSPAWAAVYRESFGKWIMFVVNVSIIAAACGIPVGFLLNRLNISLKLERNALDDLSVKTENLKSAYEMLKRETEDREHAEKALRESEEKFRNLVENVNEGIYSMDESGALTYVNPAIENILGYDRLEIIGSSFTDFIHEDDLAIQKGRFQRLMSGRIGSSEYRLVNKAGEVRWIRSSTRPVFHEKKPVFLEGILFDITDRKHMEEALVIAQQRYQSLFNSKTNLVFVMDGQGNFLDANDSALDLFGYSKKDLAGLNYFEILHKDQDLETISRVTNEILETGNQTEPLEVKLKSKNGETIYVEIGGTSIPGKSEIIGVARDITSQRNAEDAKRNLEKQLLQAQKMEAVGTIAGGIAHDFNNSLQGILGYTQILLMKMNGADTATRRLQRIEDAALRASQLTRQLLTFSREVESSLRPLDLRQEVQKLESFLRRSIPRMIDIEFHLEEDTNVISADAGQIEQVIMNLVINARDAMPGGGKVVIETENRILDDEYCRTHLGIVPGNYVILSVSDNGEGIGKEALDHIYEPFFTTKAPGKGTGLGLAMVYGIMKNHGGHITCYSEPGEGTVFRLYFPVREEQQEQRREKEQFQPKGGSETILLIDDEDSIRELTEEMLRGFGYTVIPAADGENGLEIYQKQRGPIDLIILDLIMPGMGGRRCLEEILKINPAQKVVVTTGYSANGPTKEVLQAGARDHIRKPYEMRTILTTIREVLDKP